MTNYYDDGCVPGCDSCLHHGASGAYPSGAHGCQLLPGGCFEGEDKQEGPWAAPFNVRCTVKGKPVGRGVYNVTIPGSDTLPDGARTWNRNASAMNANEPAARRLGPLSAVACAWRFQHRRPM